MSRIAIERQTIVTWHTPDEQMPEPCVVVPVTVSGRFGNVTYDHALAIADWCDDDNGWWFQDELLNRHSDRVTVHAWADLEPYGGPIGGGEAHYEHG